MQAFLRLRSQDGHGHARDPASACQLAGSLLGVLAVDANRQPIAGKGFPLQHTGFVQSDHNVVT